MSQKTKELLAHKTKGDANIHNPGGMGLLESGVKVVRHETSS